MSEPKPNAAELMSQIVTDRGLDFAVQLREELCEFFHDYDELVGRNIKHQVEVVIKQDDSEKATNLPIMKMPMVQTEVETHEKASTRKHTAKMANATDAPATPAKPKRKYAKRAPKNLQQILDSRVRTGPARPDTPILVKYRKIALNLLKQLERPMTTGEIAGRTGWTKDVTRRILQDLRAVGAVANRYDGIKFNNHSKHCWQYVTPQFWAEWFAKHKPADGDKLTAEWRAAHRRSDDDE